MSKYTKLPQSEPDNDRLDYSSGLDYRSVFTYEYPKYFSHGGHSKKFRSAFTYVGGEDPNFNKETLQGVKPGVFMRICAGVITVLCYILVGITIPVSWWICVKKIQHYERIVLFRLGRLLSTKGPGMVLILPCIDKYKRVDLRLKAFSVPPQTIMTADGGGVELGAEILHHVKDAVLSVNNVQDLNHSLRVMSQTTMQKLLTKYDISELESKKLAISNMLLEDLNKMALTWGVEVTKVELSPIKVIVEANPMLGKQNNPIEMLGHALFPPSAHSPAGGATAMQHIASALMGGMSMNQNATQPSVPKPEHTLVNIEEDGETVLFSKSKKRFETAFDLLEAVKPILSARLVAEFECIYKFVVIGDNGGTFYLDLKNGIGSVGIGEPPYGNPDVSLRLTSQDLEQLLNEEITPLSAYMTGRLQVEGDTQKARELSQLIEIINKQA